ncbi:hypothetical protein AVEN_194078-1, partial [Araneus ventricosus]
MRWKKIRHAQKQRRRHPPIPTGCPRVNPTLDRSTTCHLSGGNSTPPYYRTWKGRICLFIYSGFSSPCPPMGLYPLVTAPMARDLLDLLVETPREDSILVRCPIRSNWSNRLKNGPADHSVNIIQNNP